MEGMGDWGLGDPVGGLAWMSSSVKQGSWGGPGDGVEWLGW